MLLRKRSQRILLIRLLALSACLTIFFLAGPFGCSQGGGGPGANFKVGGTVSGLCASKQWDR